MGGWAGPHDEGGRQWQPFLDVAPARLPGSPSVHGAKIQLFDPMYPKGLQAYWKSTFLARLSDDVAGR